MHKILAVLGVNLCLFSWGMAESFYQQELTLPATLAVENTGAPDRPTVILSGLTETGSVPPQYTKGVTLNGVRLCEKLLSKSVLILYPNGTGRWGYHLGLESVRGPVFEEGKRIDESALLDYAKVEIDPLQPFRIQRTGTGLQRAFLAGHAGGQAPPLLYELHFPPSISINTLEISGLVRGEGTVRVRLFTDRERKQLLAEESLPIETHKKMKITLDARGQSKIVLEISAASAVSLMTLEGALLDATLDTAGLELPLLSTGENRLTVSDDEDSSHRVKLAMEWFHKPDAQMIWEDFEEPKPEWTGETGSIEILGASAENGTAFTGEQFLRLRFDPTKRARVMRSFPQNQPLDLSAYTHVSLALNSKQSLRFWDPELKRRLEWNVRLGWRNDGKIKTVWLNRSPSWPRPETGWFDQSAGIEQIDRDKITQFFLWIWPPQGETGALGEFTLDMDSIRFYHEHETEPAPSPFAHLEEYSVPPPPRNLKSREVPSIREWFPMGVYSGWTKLDSVKHIAWTFDQLKAHHMNTFHWTNGLELLPDAVRLAEERGIRIIYQGHGSSQILYTHRGLEKEQRMSLYRTAVAPAARAHIPPLSKAWGLAAWSLGEEVGKEIIPELSPFYGLVRELAPEQPPIFLHHRLDAAKADLKLNKPKAIIYDVYPYFWDHPVYNKPETSIRYFTNAVDAMYRACHGHGASLWMMPQAWGKQHKDFDNKYAGLYPPLYGKETQMRDPEPSEIIQQGWISVAHGATGVIFFPSTSSGFATGLWDDGMLPNAKTRAAAELFAQLRRIAPVLCRVERMLDSPDAGSNPHVVVQRFQWREEYKDDGQHFFILANRDAFNPQPIGFVPRGEEEIIDLVTRKRISRDTLKQHVLAPGQGMMLMLGSPSEATRVYDLIDRDLEAQY